MVNFRPRFCYLTPLRLYFVAPPPLDRGGILFVIARRYPDVAISLHPMV